MRQGLPVTGGPASEGAASCCALKHRKENYGHCQESCKEARREEGCEEAGSQETGCEEIGRQESAAEKARCEKSSPEEAGGQAQAECRVHEADDAGGDTRRGRWQYAAAAHRSDEEDLGIHQEEQTAGCPQQAQHQCR